MLNKILGVLSYLLLVLLVSLALIMAGPPLLGWRNLPVLSGSMEPVIPVGGMVTIHTGVPPESIRVGDIITFTIAEGEAATTHRVMEVRYAERTYLTKGDANNNVDLAPVTFDQLVGKVVLHLPLMGYLIEFMSSLKGIITIAVVMIIAVVVILAAGSIQAGEVKRKIRPCDVAAAKGYIVH